MLCEKIIVRSKKGMAMWQVVLLVLAIFVALVLLIILGQKTDLIDKINEECENNGGECVIPKNCSSCGGYEDCRSQFSFPCTDPLKICCPG